MNILAIDTSNYVLGVAVTSHSHVIGEYITNLKKNHSIRAMPAIESLLQDCDMNAKDLNKIVVAHGPGSYTGVRIGVTIAKTLAWALNIPLVGVSSLEVLAANGRHFDGYICPLFDARRGQVYTGLYKYEQNRLVTIEPDQVVLVKDWAAYLKEKETKILFLGNDLPIHQETIKEKLGDYAVIGCETQHNPRPSELAFLGKDREPGDLHRFVPNYLRLAEAEAKWLASRKE
jgi:tRNA threonylcarbamoyladenosine biosynthesis protein TsaB